ncbi:MAG: class II aldolase/adducin family protein [Candidatus Rokubacteria bacterium]|nr:class II aldolase/adducin family protein [Candidatus Rokubacteria bacterium]
MPSESAARQELIKVSAYAAERWDFVQASGGNTSVKSADGTMYVKASGCTLADVAAGRGVAVVEYSSLRLGAAAAGSDALTEWDRKSTSASGHGEPRPTMELSLHGLLGCVVLHTHPLVANAFLCVEESRARIEEVVKDQSGHLYVPYAMPGLELGLALWRVLADGARAGDDVPKVIFLENHGVVVHGDSADDVIGAHERIIGALVDALGGEADRLRFRSEQADTAVPVDVVSAIRHAVPQRPALICIPADFPVAPGVLFPDAAVFCGPSAIVLDEDARRSAAGVQRLAAEYLAAWGQPARVWVCRDVALCSGANPGEARAVAEVWLAQQVVARLAGRVGRPRPLPGERVAQLLRSESEVYRREVAVRRGDHA